MSDQMINAHKNQYLYILSFLSQCPILGNKWSVSLDDRINLFGFKL